MTQISVFKTSEGETTYLAAYEAAMKLWPVPYEEIAVPTRFGMTHVVASGPQDGWPVILLHGMLATSTMWSSNIVGYSKDYRVYAVDVIGQPSKSIPDPDEPIRETADFVAWLNDTLNGLNLERVSLIGMSYGGWIALNFAMAVPERVGKLVLLSPAASFQPFARQFALRMILMALFPTRQTVNSMFGWMGVKETTGDPVARNALELAYLGMKHFRFSPESRGAMPRELSDEELRALHVPVLLLIGEHEVIYDPTKALARARKLLPNYDGELVPGCNHDMCFRQHRIVNSRVLDFLSGN